MIQQNPPPILLYANIAGNDTKRGATFVIILGHTRVSDHMFANSVDALSNGMGCMVSTSETLAGRDLLSRRRA
jgi:hypothetical protein